MDSNNQLLSSVITPSDRAVFLEDIRSVEQALYHINLDESYHGLPPGLSHLYGKQLFDYISKQKDAISVLKNLRDCLESCDVVTLTIGFVPTASEADKILKSARNILGKMVLIDLQIDKNLLAGIRLACKGKYLDMGLGSLVDKYFESQKSNWLERLKLL